MKTAEGLFDEHSEELELYSNCGGFMGLQRFKDALTEHDKEIVSLIDEMIVWNKNKANEFNDREMGTAANIYDNRVLALTELLEILKEKK